ncbi:ABC transporter substrate-binding protein [Candidatus Chlorohelix sp.]|uniref:ABC transporter substrate-binding protein n=1 Tax=Candidatus Chlorohelix sp. TaxID=3139201 RepID=UPI003052966A
MNVSSRQESNCALKSLLLIILILSGMLLVACGDSTATTVSSTITASGAVTAAKNTVASGATTTAAATSGGAKTKIIYATSGANAESAPLYLGIEKGYFAANNLEVEIALTNGTADLIPLVATGQASGGGSTWGATFFNASKNKSTISILGSLGQVPSSGQTPARIIVSKAAYDSGQVKKVADLKGKKVAIPGPGAFAEYSFYLALKTGGLSIKDVELVNIPFPQQAAAIKTGSVVAAFASEPISTQLEADGTAVTLVDGHAGGTELTFMIFNTDFLNKNTDAVTRFLSVYIKILRELDAGGWKDPEVQKIVEKYTKVPGALLSKIALSVHNSNVEININSVRAQEAYFRERGVLSYTGDLDLESLIRKDIIQKALQSL